MLDRLRSALALSVDDPRNTLALTRFEGVCDAFEQLQARIPSDWLQTGSPTGSSHNVLVFYAVASTRMQRAEQLCAALIDGIKFDRRDHTELVRNDLERLTDQLDQLTLAAAMELAQAGVIMDKWESESELLAALRPAAQARSYPPAHTRVLFNSGLMLLANLQQQLDAREPLYSSTMLTPVRLLLDEARHTFDVVGPLVNSQQSDLTSDDTIELPEDLLRRMGRTFQLLDAAAAELVVPGSTRRAPGNALLEEIEPWPESVQALQDNPPPPRSRMGIVAGMGLVVALIIGVLVFLSMKPLSSPIEPVNVQPVVISQPTMESDSLVERMPTVVPTGEILDSDRFEDPSTEWPVSSSATGSLGYRDGTYEIAVVVSDWVRWVSTGERYSNVDVAVDVMMVAGPLDQTAYGVLFREQAKYQMYLFEIRPDGRYILRKAMGENDDKEMIWEDVTEWQFSSVINQGLNQTNRLRVVAVERQIQLYINNVLVQTVEDAEYNRGTVGMAVDTFEKGGGVVRFDNLEIREP